jgi:hypothetical protein
MLVVPLWTAVVEIWRIPVSGQECNKLESVTARQACYEELSARLPRHPVKGPTAPPIPRPLGRE